MPDPQQPSPDSPRSPGESSRPTGSAGDRSDWQGEQISRYSWFPDGHHLSHSKLAEMRAEQISTAVSRGEFAVTHYIRFGFLKDIAASTIQARYPESAWNAFLSVLCQMERPTYGYIRHLCSGISNLTRNTGPSGVHHPMDRAEWQMLAATLLAVDRAGERPAHLSQQRIPEVVLQLIRLNPPAEYLTGLARIACRAVAQGRAASTIERDLRLFVDTARHLTQPEAESVILKMREQSSKGSDRSGPLVTTWDIAAARVQRLEKLGISHRPALERLSRARAMATQTHRQPPNVTVFEACVSILDSATEICLARGDSSGQGLAYIADVFANHNSSKVSLAILSEKILPYYQFKKWPVEALLFNFAPAGDSPELLAFQKYVVDNAMAKGLPLDALITKEFQELSRDKANAAVVAAYTDCFMDPAIASHPALRDAQILSSASGVFVKIARHAIDVWKNPAAMKNMISNYLDIAHFAAQQVGSGKAVLEPIKNLDSSVDSLFSLRCPASVLAQIALATRTDEDYSVDLLISDLCETKCHWAMFRKVQGAAPEIEEAARLVLARDYGHDSVPYRLGDHPDPRGLEAHRQIQNFTWRVMQPSKGFSRWTSEARRIPGRDHSALIEFGLDVSGETGYLNSSGIEEFPGNGFYIDGLLLERSLVKNTQHADPYHEYRENLSFAKHLEDWEGTRYITARGFIAITGPDNERFKLPVSRSAAHPEEVREEHFTMIIFNDHFHNPGCHVACAVPTRVFDRILQGTHIPADEYAGYDQSKPDLTQLDLTYEELQDVCRQMGATFLDLGWPSNLGGMCNAYPPLSGPYHLWENKRANSIYKDRTGHIHKTFILENYSWTLTHAHERALQPLRTLHTRVLEFGHACLDCFDGFKFLEALWHKGQTLARPDTIGALPTEQEDYGGDAWKQSDSDANDPQRGPAQPSGERIERVTPDPNAEERPPMGPYSARRLHEIYLWHKASQEGMPASRIPIFRICKAMNVWPEQSPLEIDPITLTLKTSHFEVQLPEDGDGKGAEELDIWHEYVMPFARTANDFSFWARSSR